MRLQVSIKQRNDEYSQEYADQYQFGEESVNNQKYNFSTSFDFETKIDSIELLKNQDLIIEGKYEDDDKNEPVKLQLKNMTILNCIKDDNIYEMYAVSDDFIHQSHKASKEKRNKTYFTFYLKDRKDFENFGHNIYALKKDVLKL